MTSRTDLHPDTLPDPHRRKLGRLLVVTAAGGSSLLALTSGARAQSLEKKKVTILMEGLNSKVDHKDYHYDRTAWGVKLCKMVGSERFKLLYDV